MHADRHTSRGVYTMFWTLTCRFLKGYHWNEDITFLNVSVQKWRIDKYS